MQDLHSTEWRRWQEGSEWDQDSDLSGPSAAVAAAAAVAIVVVATNDI